MQFIRKPCYAKQFMEYSRAEGKVNCVGTHHPDLTGNSDKHNRLNTKRD